MYMQHTKFGWGEDSREGGKIPLWPYVEKTLLLLILCTPFQLVWLGMSLRDYCIAGKFGGELNFGGLAV